MNYSYRTFFQNIYREQGQQFAFSARNKREFAVWKEKLRAALWEELGLSVLEQVSKRRPLQKEQLVEEIREKGYYRRKYVVETLPEVFMPFYMLIPDVIDESHTGCAMLVIPAHGANKNTVCGVGGTPEEKAKIAASPAECYGEAFVRQGYVVFCPDPPGYGERNEVISGEDNYFAPDRKKNSLDCSCRDLSQTAEALGFSFTALEIWDLLRLTDFAYGCLQTEGRKEDGILLGAAGFSGGGQYAMWLAAMDDRIRLCVISGYVHGYWDSILECHLCPCNYAPKLWKLCDVSDICSLIAPRPLFVENGTEDVENGPGGIEGPKRQVEKIRRAYALFHAQEKVVHHTPKGPHQWYGGCYEFVAEIIKKRGRISE